jgi:TPR repeat protein
MFIWAKAWINEEPRNPLRGGGKRTGETHYSDKETEIVKRGYISYNPETAYAWFHAAATAERPVAHSQCMIAAMYEQGIGCVKDIEEAMYWYNRSMSGGTDGASETAAGINNLGAEP